jgi:hypothetical protein
LGNNREIFFPRFEEAQMMTFSDIAIKLLEAHGYIPITCTSEADAINASGRLKTGGIEYPVYFSKADTTGEKDFEEFYTTDETVDMHRFSSLGIITGSALPEKEKLDALLAQLNDIFSKNDASKAGVVRVLKGYLPNFDHREKNKFLDEKM